MSKNISDILQAEIEKKELAIKQLQETQDQLLQIGKTAILGQFMASIAHELNNPLTFLLASAEQLNLIVNQDNLDREQAKKLTSNINRGAQRILQISNHLKTFLHSPLSDQDLIYSDIHDVIEKSITFTQHYTRKHSISVQNNTPMCLPHTLMDPSLIEQIAINLIRNSVEALADNEGSQNLLIEINGKYDEKSNSITISFVDHGPGIPPSVIDKIFTPFFTTKPMGQGTGLGLNICAYIAEKHGGTLTASSNPGEGATFYLTLPIKAPPQMATKGPHSKSLDSLLKGRKILLIDDEADIREIQKAILSKLGCQVYEARNGVEALEQCREQKPDVAITDLIMAEMTGIEFAEKAKELYGDMKIILLTGSVALENLGEHRVLFDDLIAKPFPRESIRKALIHVLEKESTAH